MLLELARCVRPWWPRWLLLWALSRLNRERLAIHDRVCVLLARGEIPPGW
jgi:hypothetical protein